MKKTLYAKGLAFALFLSYYGQAFAENIVDTAEKDKTFKTFVTAIKKSGLEEKLKDSGPYTVFAPGDEAFNKLPPGKWEAISKDKSKLNKVLSYHIIPGQMLITEVKPGKIKTVEGDMLTLTSDNGKVTVNNANVTQSDIKADNGIIHAIDAVVLPPDE